MRGFNPFRCLQPTVAATTAALAAGSQSRAMGSTTTTTTGSGGGGGAGHRSNSKNHDDGGGACNMTHTSGAASTTSSAGVVVPPALTTPSRGLHRATHPLLLLRRQNSNATSYSSSQRGATGSGGGLHTGSKGGEVIALSLAKGVGHPGHPANCPCCSRRAYGSYKSPQDERELTNLRNMRNAQKSMDRSEAHAAAAVPARGGRPYHHHRTVDGELDTFEDASNVGAHADATGVDGEGENLEKEVARFVGARMVRSLQREQPPRGSGIQPLLDYNKQWAGEIARLNNNYFSDLAQQQAPQYLWVGCSDSRVPANEIVGLYPGDIFVHRNIANIVCNSDLNVLAVLQYAIDCLKVEHVIVSGHYQCGGVTAALNDDRVGLADHWILHVSAVKKRHWKRMCMDVPTPRHLDALCELNVISQVESVVETHLVQRVWSRQNAEDELARREGRPTRNKAENEVEIHGWVYGLEDGVIRPLLSLTRRSHVERELADATAAVFWRYGQLT